MAIIKPSELITSISGKIGGSVFVNSPQGFYLRRNSYSQNPRTPRQQVQKSVLASISPLWRQLSAVQRSSFVAASVDYQYINRSGGISTRTGYGLFLFLNNNLNLISQSLVTTAPLFVVAPELLLVSWSLVGGNITLVPTGWSAPIALVLYGTLVSGNNVLYKESNLKYLAVWYTGGGNGPINATFSYTQRYGPIPLGSVLYFRIKGVVRTTGQTGLFSNVLRTVG